MKVNETDRERIQVMKEMAVDISVAYEEAGDYGDVCGITVGAGSDDNRGEWRRRGS